MSSSTNPQKCPVDHGASSSQQQPSAECPVAKEPTSRSFWSSLFSSSSSSPPSTSPHSPASLPPLPPHTQQLSTSREISSIPRLLPSSGESDNNNDNSNWVYPSETQFFNAMTRKNHNPKEADMKTIVPIHNAVNERAWTQILEWEAGRGGGEQETCIDVPRLVSFVGRPQERSPKARWKMLLGYAAPFDRHDWIVDRCGIRMRYVIDFYTGRAPTQINNTASPIHQPQVSFYLDVRPALDSWEGVKLRAQMFFQKSFLGGSTSTLASQGKDSK